MQVRPFVVDDILRVAALRRTAFRRTRAKTEADLADYFRTIFFENPWIDPELPSFVLESETGDVIGFIGIIPKPMTLRGKRVRAAVATQLMVARGRRGGAGGRLLRHAMAGAQDLLLVDSPTARVRELWEESGGSTAEGYAFQWSHPLRLAPRRLGVLMRGVEALARSTRLHPLTGLATDAQSEELTPETMAGAFGSFLGPNVLRAEFDHRSAEWLLERAAERWGEDHLRARAVRATDGRLLGWYIYVRQRFGVAGVVQIVSDRENYADVWNRLLLDAHDAGSSSVQGRYNPWVMPVLRTAERVSFRARTPGLLAHARDPDLLVELLRGNAFFSGLDGEWWLSF